MLRDVTNKKRLLKKGVWALVEVVALIGLLMMTSYFTFQFTMEQLTHPTEAVSKQAVRALSHSELKKDTSNDPN